LIQGLACLLQPSKIHETALGIKANLKMWSVWVSTSELKLKQEVIRLNICSLERKQAKEWMSFL
jgi:hypothetical protein